MRPAVFLDRDGTIIEDVHYLTDPASIRLIEGAGEALARLSKAGFALVVVTNQSAIGRGWLTEEGLETIHDAMRDRFAPFVTFDGIYHSPFAPSGTDRFEIEDPLRKPAPGMLRRAARDLDLDLERSWMIGDAVTDALAGRNAGCRGTILVRTGRGASEETPHPAVDHVATDLTEAAALIEALLASTEDR